MMEHSEWLYRLPPPYKGPLEPHFRLYPDADTSGR